jgi:hypothetical protein
VPWPIQIIQEFSGQGEHVSILDRYQFLTEQGFVTERGGHVGLIADFAREWDLEALIYIYG